MVLDAATKDKLRQQVEFYFSDSNLPRDKFLSDKVRADPEGFVDLALLAIFSRVQQLLKTDVREASAVPAATVADVADALEGAASLALSEDRKRVKRATELKDTQEVAREVDERSLYVAPFPYDATLDALSAFFGGLGGARVQCVRMRRHMASKDFKGSCFVEFATREEADKVRGMSLEFEGAPLKMEGKLEYIARKEEERKSRPNSPAAANAAGAAAAAAAGAGGRKRRAEGDAGGRDAAAAAAVGAAGGAAAAGEQEEEGEEAEVEVPEYETGCVLHFDFGEAAEFAAPPTFGLVKDTFGGRMEGGVQFVDYNTGDKSGGVRFMTPAQAQTALAKAEGGEGEGGAKMMVAGYSAAVRVLGGDEEAEYMKRAAQQRAAADRKRQQEGGGRGRGGRGGRGRGGRGRGGGGRGGGKRGRHN